MVATTALHGITKPDLTFDSDIPSWLGPILDQIDGSLSYLGETTPTHKPGLLWYKPSANLLRQSDGTQWTTLVDTTPQTRAWKATPRSGTSDNFSAGARTSRQSLTFSGPPGWYQIVSRMSISSSLAAADAGFAWINAGGTDLMASAHADVNSAQRELFAFTEWFHTTAGGSLTVHHDYELINHIGTVWNGDSTSLQVFWLGA
jgi:hypothetical protein